MKGLAISNIAWPVELDREVAERMRAHGFTGVEIAPTKYWPDITRVADADLARVRQRWNEQGIEIVAMQALLFGKPELRVFGDEPTRDRLLEHLEACNRIAAALGARVLVFGSPKNRKREGLSDEAALEIASAFFGRAGEAAARHGVCLCIEPNPSAYDCDFVTTMREARELVTRVGHPGFGLHGDLGQLVMTGEPIAAAIGDARGMLRHFHASEPSLAPVASSESHVAAAAALRAIEYPNVVSIEMRAAAAGTELATIETALTAVARIYAR